MKVERWHVWAVFAIFGLPSLLILAILANGGDGRLPWPGYAASAMGLTYTLIAIILYSTQVTLSLRGRFKYQF